VIKKIVTLCRDYQDRFEVLPDPHPPVPTLGSPRGRILRVQSLDLPGPGLLQQTSSSFVFVFDYKTKLLQHSSLGLTFQLWLLFSHRKALNWKNHNRISNQMLPAMGSKLPGLDGEIGLKGTFLGGSYWRSLSLFLSLKIIANLMKQSNKDWLRGHGHPDLEPWLKVVGSIYGCKSSFQHRK